jgi:hypothetical protein
MVKDTLQGAIYHNARNNLRQPLWLCFRNIINPWAKLKGVRARGQVGFKEGRFTLDHILTQCTLIEQHIFVGRRLYSCFVDIKIKK